MRDDPKPIGPKPVLLSSATFVKAFVAPDFLVDGVMQKGFLYAMTGATGSGKTAVALNIAKKVALGEPICGHETCRSRVVIFAGENSTDVRMRWIAMAEAESFDAETIDVHFIDGVFSLADFQNSVAEQVKDLGGCGLIIVDTSAAYFEGDDENSNTELGAHARMLRGLTRFRGSPCVLVLCHPIKNANPDNLLPRGGGSFVAEVDGNLTTKGYDMTTELHWAGKLRGADFEPLHFELQQATAPSLKNSKSRQVWTIIARDLSQQEAEVRQGNVVGLQDKLLLAMDGPEELSIAGYAMKLGWTSAGGAPQKSRVHGFMKSLERDHLVTKVRSDRYQLTEQGKKVALKLTAKTVQASERPHFRSTSERFPER